MTRTAVRKAILLLACLVGSGCYSTYRVRPGLDDLYVYTPGQEERPIEVELEQEYAAGAEGRRLRVAEKERGLELWVGPLRVSGQAQVVVKVRPAGYQGSPEAIKGNFQRFWDAHKADLDRALGAAARDEIAQEVVNGLPPDGLPRSAATILEEDLKLRHYSLPDGTPDVGMAQIDLQPGMRLRIEEATVQRMLGDTPSNTSIESGYMSVGPTYYSVTRRPDGKIAFEPFLGRLDRMGAAPEILRGPAAGQLDASYLVGSVLDLHSKEKEFKRFRLIYPKIFPNSRSTVFAPCDRVVLVGADSEDGLKWACGLRLKDEEEANCVPAGQPCRFVSRFRGRSLVIPEIAVSVNGEPTWISVGTTLRNLVEPFRDLSKPAGRRTVKLSRRSTEGTYAPFDLAAPATDDGIDPFDLPLLPGDRVVLAGGF